MSDSTRPRDLDPAAAARIDARLQAAAITAADDEILRRARTRVAAGLATRRAAPRPLVVALAALLPAAAAAALALAVVYHFGHPVAQHVVTGPTPTASVGPVESPSPEASPQASPAPSPSPARIAGYLASIQMLTAESGWGVVIVPAPRPTDASHLAPHEIVHTGDGGHTWTLIASPGLDRLAATYFLDSTHIWAVTTGAVNGNTNPQVANIWSSANGGLTWAGVQISVDGAVDYPGQSGIDFVDASHGWLTTYNGAAAGSSSASLYATADGGATWRKVATATPGTSATPSPGQMPGSCTKHEAVFSSASNGFLTTACPGGDTWLWASHDGGHTWSAVHLPLADLTTGTVGDCDCSATPPTFSGRNGFLMLNGAVEAGALHTLYTTHDSGASWTGHALPGHLAPGMALGGPSMLADALSGWAIVSPPDYNQHPTTGQLYATTDGGAHWQLTRGQPEGGTGEPDFVTNQIGWILQETQGVFGDNVARLLQTTDGAASWKDLQYTIAG